MSTMQCWRCEGLLLRLPDGLPFCLACGTLTIRRPPTARERQQAEWSGRLPRMTEAAA